MRYPSPEDRLPDLRVALYRNFRSCAAIVGACCGFLIYNYSPASVFMGDSGSLFLGFNVAVLLALVTVAGDWRGLIAGGFVFGFPIFDTVLGVARRALNRRPLFVGDRSHFYDQLRDRGWSTKGTVIACYFLSAVSAAIGCAGLYLSDRTALLTAVGVPLLLAVACKAFGFLRVDDAATRSEQAAGVGGNAEG